MSIINTSLTLTYTKINNQMISWYFYSDSRKVPRIKADVLPPVNSTPYDSWCTTFDFFVALSARRLIVGASSELRTTDEADIAHVVVSELPTARKLWYIFSPDFVQIAKFLACNGSARRCLFWINVECICRRRFYYFPIIRPVLVERC